MRIGFTVALFALLASLACAQDTPYREDGWAKFPDGRRWGWTSGIDIDKRGNIWVFSRCERLVDRNLGNERAEVRAEVSYACLRAKEQDGVA